ncbi:hypothetical protein [Nocardia amamiensis]|uniref:hypothetical protein n=1 Tax=Nocardia amamiensis TaxID=404578 RepID=UPI00340891FE
MRNPSHKNQRVPGLTRMIARAVVTMLAVAAAVPVLAAPANSKPAGPATNPNLDRCYANENPGHWTPEWTIVHPGTNPEYGGSRVTLLRPGDVLRITVDPTSKVKPSRWPWEPSFGPDGDASNVGGDDYPAPGKPRYSLVGGPGAHELDFIGSKTICYENATDETQEYHLNVNDNNTGDNSEGFVVTLRKYYTLSRDEARERGWAPEYAVKRCQMNWEGEREARGDFRGGNSFEPIRFTLYPGEVYHVWAESTVSGPAPVPGYNAPEGVRVPPSIKVGPWPWDSTYGPNGAGWDNLAPDGWPAPDRPKYGLIGAWEGLPGYYWVGGDGVCIQWTGSTPVTVALTMNDDNLGDNEGLWRLRIPIFSPDLLCQFSSLCQ